MKAKLPLLVLLAVLGCSEADGPAEWTGTVTDSAGIEIVTNPARGLWTRSSAWRVRGLHSLGTEGDAGAGPFERIRGVDVDSTGNVYVLDGAAAEVRAFNPDGEHLRTFGQPDREPGYPIGLFIIDGEILVPDLRTRQLNRYSLEGEPLGDADLKLTSGITIHWDGPAAGRILVQQRPVRVAPRGGAENSVGDAIVALNGEGVITDTILVLPQVHGYVFEDWRPVLNLFASRHIWSAGREGTLVTGMTGQARIEVRGPEGALLRVVELAAEREAIPEEDAGALLEGVRRFTVAQGMSPEEADEMVEASTVGERYPLFTRLLVGPDATVWAQRARSGRDLVADAEDGLDPRDLGSAVWEVFDDRGRYLGTVELPEGVQLLRLHGDRAYGVVAGEGPDTETLEVFEIERPEG